MKFAALVTLAVTTSGVWAFPKFTGRDVMEGLKRNTRCNDAQTARRFVIPPFPADTSSKKIPDEAHPFQPFDPATQTRGPCPMLNTLANHGYLDRSGVDTTENIIKAVMEGANMEHDFATFLVSFATMARGNANTAMLSIGFDSDKVPPLPGCIDGPVAGGIAKHGRFEGDVSISRPDHGVGDSVNFNSSIFGQFLERAKTLAGDGPEGPHTVVNIPLFQEYKFQNYNEDQAADNQLQYHVGRQLSAFFEVAFVLELMQDGRTNQSSVRQVTSFFQNQTFGPDFFRRQGPAGLDILGTVGMEARSAHPVPAGANDANGNYIVDTPAFTNFVCDGYQDIVENNLASVLNDAKGIFGENVQTMLQAVFHNFNNSVFKCPTKFFPKGQAGV